MFTYKSDRVLFEMSDPSSDTVGSAGSDCEYTETSDENSGSEHYFWVGGGGLAEGGQNTGRPDNSDRPDEPQAPGLGVESDPSPTHPPHP